MTHIDDDGELDWEDIIRRFLRNPNDEAARRAFHRRLEVLLPDIRKIVERTIWNDKFKGLREDATQGAMAKLCDRQRLQKWLDSRKRTKFPYWAYIVARNHAMDVLREAAKWDEIKKGLEHDVPTHSLDPSRAAELKERARKLQRQYRQALSELNLGKQLVVLMKYSYLEPTPPEIAASLGIAESTVYSRWRRAVKDIRDRLNVEDLSELAGSSPVGCKHPVATYETLFRKQKEEHDQQKEINRRLNAALIAYSPEEKAVFYMKYSPLTTDNATIAEHFGLSEEIVGKILTRISQSRPDLFGPNV